MKARKECRIIVEMSLDEANVILRALAEVNDTEKQVLDFRIDSDDALKKLKSLTKNLIQPTLLLGDNA